MNNKTEEKVVTRMPPSPTGHLHIGTVRTALFNFLFARHHGGRMVFRSEDTDKDRSKREFEAEIIDGLHSLGISWDNPELIRQSERAHLYRSYIENAIGRGSLYLSNEESKSTPGTMVEVVRLKNPNKSITFTDLIRGDITFDTTELGDVVVARSIDDALYHLTVVVDDFEMGVTHVLRGEDHVSNTPRQILIQEALNLPRPAYAHLPLILAPDRSKMSKRHGAVALNEYLKEGFTKEAIINYLVLLGWNPGTDQEIFTMDELVAQFDIDHIQKSGAVFDRQKFLWINKQHLNRMDNATYTNYVHTALPDTLRILPQYSDERLMRLIPTIRERVHVAREITDAAVAHEYDFAFLAPEINSELIKWKKDVSVTDTASRLNVVVSLLGETSFETPALIEEALTSFVATTGKGEVLWPMRVALTGLERSPDPYTVAHILGRDETLARLKSACAKMTE